MAGVKWNRREFSALLTSALLAGHGFAQESKGKKPRNVLLLMSDQHRPAALSLNGNTPARTPNLDALARSGVRFQHAYCSSPVCLPSRASLLTGLWPHNHGAVNNDAPWSFEHKTLAHYFNRAGYVTGLIGKMHFVDAQTHGFGYHLGFADWMQYLGPKTQLFADEIGELPAGACGLPEVESIWDQSGDPWTGHIVDDGRTGPTAIGRQSFLEEHDHFESFVTRESIRFLRSYKDGDEPFFLIASYLKPHGPFTPAARFFHQFAPDDMRLPDTWGKVDLSTAPAEIRNSINNDWLTPELRDPKNAQRRMALYYASLLQMDDNIGRMLQALRELGLEEDTIVLYTTDHGEMLGEHGLWQKSVFYEQSVGVPLIVRAPSVTPAGSVSNTPVSIVSVMPTLLELCGLSSPQGDGQSLLADLRSPQQTRDATVYAEIGLHGKAAKAMVRRGSYKCTMYSHDSPDELYDLVSDPKEMNNLALQSGWADKLAEMKGELLAWHIPA